VATAPGVRCHTQGTVVVLDGSSLAVDPRLSIGRSVPVLAKHREDDG
jgi:hypothetical protein